MSMIALDVLAAVWQYIVIAILALVGYMGYKSKKAQKVKLEKTIAKHVQENLTIKQDLRAKSETLNKVEKANKIESEIADSNANNNDAVNKLREKWTRD